MRTILILESRAGCAAFNAQRLDAVMLIAGQLAVSLANAQLYESLERRVQARTSELEETQARLVSTARRAGMAEVANNVLHNVGNILNSVNVSATVLQRTINESRSLGLAQAVGLLNEYAGDLSGFMRNDPRAATLMTYVQELVNALGQERESALQDIERLMRSIEHITYVVAHQQSHSGPSSILETVHPHELVREALRLSEEVVKSAGATVVGAHTVVESAALDRSRFLQILVNLIGNAAQAMAGMPVNTRVLTISTDIARVDARKSLRITVEDAGHGITPENLKRIFSHGFTTRDGGHEFGLHSSALAAMEMGGRVLASSAGPGLGAVFTLEVPLK